MGGSYVPPNRRPGRKADDSNNKRGRGAEANPVATLLKGQCHNPVPLPSE
jgi:hypothetical protein